MAPTMALQPQLQLLKDLPGQSHDIILRQIQMLQLAQGAQTLRQHLWRLIMMQPSTKVGPGNNGDHQLVYKQVEFSGGMWRHIFGCTTDFEQTIEVFVVGEGLSRGSCMAAKRTISTSDRVYFGGQAPFDHHLK